ncbi:MAG: phosphoglycerate mutase family protein [Chitinophagaceae bacterium]|nr:phosphoglycerate mutase family protein [Chitinophagaceae bacterium]
MKPKRIVLIRHGESKGNVDRSVYAERPDYALELSEKGIQQAFDAGKKLATLIGSESLMLYVSPHWRTRMTSEGILQSFNNNRILIREEPRIREQEWGHLRSMDTNKMLDSERDAFGTFYYRFADGESCADVYDRVSGFFDTLFRDFEKDNFPENTIIVTHGMTIRVFLMRWYRWTVEKFETVANPGNCEYFVMEKRDNNKYELMSPLKFHEPHHPYQYPGRN